MPPRKSRYFLPVESKTSAPLPRVNTIGERLYVGNRNWSASRSACGERAGFRSNCLPEVFETDALIRVVFDLRIIFLKGLPKGPLRNRRESRARPDHAQRGCPEQYWKQMLPKIRRA